MKSDSKSSTRDVATENEAKDIDTPETAQVRFTEGWTRPEFYKISQAGQQFPCLVCGRHPAGKKCGRCRSAVYCSVQCQEMDYTIGGHKSNCKLLKSLFEEKGELERELCSSEDGEEEERGVGPAVGEFWMEVTNPFSPLYDSSRQLSASKTMRYCVCLLQLVQILGRGESWRVKKTKYHPTLSVARARRDKESNECIEPDPDEDSLGDTKYSPEAGNALALVMALDVGLDLLYLDRTDLRVRLCIPSLYLELGMLQEAYDFIKFWLLPSSTAMLESLVQNEFDHMGEIVDRPYLNLSGENMTEKPESWADFLAFYPSVGMVFEMALIKIKLADKARRSAEGTRFASSPDDSWNENGRGVGAATNASTDVPCDDTMNSSAAELERQARLLLSCVHKLNPHLLPPMGGYRPSSEPGSPPAAVTELLNHTPGLDLQYRMGNAGGGSKEEAIGVWQKDMVVWDNDKAAMEFLSTFASDLENNLVPIPADASRVEAMTKAKSLADKLKEQNPNMSADQVMMHPEMAKLMIEQLQEGGNSEAK